jgi:hypothetical protein
MTLPINSAFLQRENLAFFKNLLVAWEQAADGLNFFMIYLYFFKKIKEKNYLK